MAVYQVKIPACTFAGEGSIEKVKDIVEKEQAKTALVFTDQGIKNAGILACLTEDPGQLYYRTASGSDNVLQHTARTDTWQLVDITHQDQSGSHTDSFQQGIHQENVYHGHFINDDHIRFQRIFFIPFK